jgi:hypothetical protein
MAQNLFPICPFKPEKARKNLAFDWRNCADYRKNRAEAGLVVYWRERTDFTYI